MNIELFDSLQETLERTGPVGFDRIAVRGIDAFAGLPNVDRPAHVAPLWGIPIVVDSDVREGTAELRLGDKLVHLLVHIDEPANQSDRGV